LAICSKLSLLGALYRAGVKGPAELLSAAQTISGKQQLTAELLKQNAKQLRVRCCFHLSVIYYNWVVDQ
jgi:hypothetical protein